MLHHTRKQSRKSGLHARACVVSTTNLRRRHARLMEIDPKYADCIVRRYQEYTGKQALLDSEGRTFDEVALARAGAPA